MSASFNLQIVRLDQNHDLNGFDCGDAGRNQWFCNRARANQRSDDSRTYVLADGPEVAGFYALTVGAVPRGVLPGALRRNAPELVACVVLAQLAVATLLQGRGYSRELLIHAMGRAAEVAAAAGCRLFVVHPATPRLVAYYANAGFTEVDTTPPLMAMSLARVRATLAGLTPPSC